MKVVAQEYRIRSLLLLAPFWLVILSLVAVYALGVWIVGIIQTLAHHKPSFTTPYDPKTDINSQGVVPIVNNIYTNGFNNPYAAYMRKTETPPAGNTTITNNSTVNNYYLNQTPKEEPKPAAPKWGPTFVADPDAKVIDNTPDATPLPKSEATKLNNPQTRPALPNLEATATYTFEDEFGRKGDQRHG